ncbi:MAG: electron transfer flavoprotein subunit beta/FixA family protein, partial [Anaerotignaceae bacterium]
MEILVCVKQVPDDSVEVKFDETIGGGKIDAITPVVNAFDGYALEMAARFKEAHGGNVTVVSLGEEKAKDSVRNCLSVGANKGFVVVDEIYKNSDTLATSYILSKAMAKIEEIDGTKFDIVFCGFEATDYMSGQVGIQLAEILNYPQVTSIVA